VRDRGSKGMDRCPLTATALTQLQKYENLPKKTTLNSFASLCTLFIVLSLSTLEFSGPYRHIGRSTVMLCYKKLAKKLGRWLY
jgi:hypothetical protein